MVIIIGLHCMHSMRTWPIATDRVAWSVFQSVGLLVTVVSTANMAEPIEMYRIWTWVGLRDCVLDGAPIPSCKGALLAVQSLAHPGLPAAIYLIQSVLFAKRQHMLASGQ